MCTIEGERERLKNVFESVNHGFKPFWPFRERHSKIPYLSLTHTFLNLSFSLSLSHTHTISISFSFWTKCLKMINAKIVLLD